MKKIGLYFTFLALFWGLNSCVSQRSNKSHVAVDKEAVLTTGEWLLVSVRNDIQGNVKYPSPDRLPTLQVDKDGKYSGYDGCNNFHGNCTFSGDSIVFKSAISTLKACLDEQLVDDLLRSAFEEITNYSVEGNQLILKKHSESFIIYKR
ncbi:MAG: META domain-containing protein [Tannerella sp.]|jgi:heat shock protein HslJ|nr:META domain-containing protein [Tannerella sp.]